MLIPQAGADRNPRGQLQRTDKILFPYGHVQCDTSVSYRSVVIFGTIRIVEDDAQKLDFFRAFMAKYAPPDSWGREPDSFPRLAATTVYAIAPVTITGKGGVLPGVADRWPRRNATRSPNGRPTPGGAGEGR